MKRGEVVELWDERDERLGSVCIEEAEVRDWPLDPRRTVLRCSGPFRPTAAWAASEIRRLFAEVHEAADEGAFSVIDPLVERILARGIRLALAVDGTRVPVVHVFFHGERLLEWSVPR